MSSLTTSAAQLPRPSASRTFERNSGTSIEEMADFQALKPFNKFRYAMPWGLQNSEVPSLSLLQQMQHFNCSIGR